MIGARAAGGAMRSFRAAARAAPVALATLLSAACATPPEDVPVDAAVDGADDGVAEALGSVTAMAETPGATAIGKTTGAAAVAAAEADARAPAQVVGGTAGAEAATASAVRTVDADADGVADGEDVCPATAGGEIVDARGCPLFTRALDGVVFATDDAALDASSRAALLRLVADLEAHPDVAIRLEGHTDNRGLASRNLELSKRRVMAVARFLVVHGVAPERLRPYGYGESRPRAYNATARGRERNRRIEIALERERLDDAPLPRLARPSPSGQNAAMPEKTP